MKVVAPQDLIPGVIYRIHWNGHNNDMLGTFLFHHPIDPTHTRPCFTNVNYQNDLFGDPGERPRKIDRHQIVFDPAHHTFYKSGDTLQRKENTSKLLERVFGTKQGKEYFGGRKRKRTRRNKRV
jgi:hypothetical protein